MEVNWGEPLVLVVSPDGAMQKITTAEQARHWLRKKWPVADQSRDGALHHVEAAMECMTSVGAARRAFTRAARTAGLLPESQAGTPRVVAVVGVGN